MDNHRLKPCLWKNRIVWRLGCLLMTLFGCALFQEEEVIYLKEARRLHATQTDVERRLGSPKFAHTLSSGETVWRYVIWTNTGGDLNGPGTSYCDQYDLRFDQMETLRDWTRQTC